MEDAKKILKNVFGYDSFRPLQREIIENVLNKKDTLVIMPTGGGKSLCYQVPALMFDGLTIVISPLISLMKDQVLQLKQYGIDAALLNSSLTIQEYNKNYYDVLNKKVKLLYLAPESLSKDDIKNLISEIKTDCLTIDEAHCISEWGHDFRPEYRQLGELRKKIPDAVCIALTATATPRVQDDIVKNLNMQEGGRFLASFNRDNLFLQVIPKADSFNQTLRILREHQDQSGIIYCFSRKQVDSLYQDLLKLKFSVKPYHAGLTDKERNENQELFIKDEIQIIVATIAFGMGINKSNVRFVLHHDLPKNIESYYQEIGRAGRDGVKADCVLLYSYADVSKINYFIEQKENDSEKLSAKMHLDSMVRYAESGYCRRHALINYFGEKYEVSNCGFCDNCLSDSIDLIDVTIPAQKFLSAVKRTGEIFGANHIVDVLCGAEADKIFSFGHQNLSVYGIGTEFNKKQWLSLANQFISKGLLLRGQEYGSLKLTEKSYDVLLRKEKVYGVVKEQAEITVKPKTAGQQYDFSLFELLKKKRKQIADDNDLPPFVVFSDKTLIQMATNYPVTENEMLSISGIGMAKLEKYGAPFLSVIKKYCAEKKIKTSSVKVKREKTGGGAIGARHKEIGALFNSGKTIEQLAAKYEIQPQTIINHLAKFNDEGNAISLKLLKENITIKWEVVEKVIQYFNSEGTDALKPVFEKLNGGVSYENLHLIRLYHKCKGI
jgi:ATP-dependent DNA helicase RecQ